MTSTVETVAGATCRVTRSGYTGEDGFELSLEACNGLAVARALLDQPEVRLAGLGARDSLRLEAGLCLYGHELDETTTPVEADLAWTIPKARRVSGARAGGFPGADVIANELELGAKRRRIGLQPDGKTIVREGAELVTSNGDKAGVVTSGGFGSTLEHPIAMILAIAFLLIVSLVVSAALSALGKWWDPWFHGWEALAHVLNFVVSFGLVTVLFALIYKIIPRVEVAWHDVWVGAAVTSLLFTIGKFLISLYLGKSDVGSSFGAAGSLVIVMVWVYYSSQIFLVGAEFTWVYAHELGSRRGVQRPGTLAKAEENHPGEPPLPGHEGRRAQPA